jgi:putative transcriptional regulator
MKKSNKPRMADGLMRGLKQAIQMEKGEVSGRERVSTLSRPAPKWTKKEIQKLRIEVFHMSQPIFASLLNVKPATIRAWEQGQRTPDGAASRLLEILANDQDIAEELAS